MIDRDIFRKSVRIAAVVCFAICVPTVVLALSSRGKSCPALTNSTPFCVLITIGVAVQAIFWRRAYDHIGTIKDRFDPALQNPLGDMATSDATLIAVLVFFVVLATTPLIQFFLLCL